MQQYSDGASSTVLWQKKLVVLAEGDSQSCEIKSVEKASSRETK